MGLDCTKWVAVLDVNRHPKLDASVFLDRGFDKGFQDLTHGSQEAHETPDGMLNWGHLEILNKPIERLLSKDLSELDWLSLSNLLDRCLLWWC